MKKILTNIPLITFSLMLIVGMILGALVIAQYHIESIPTDKELRAQVDKVYDEITEEDLDVAREETAEVEFHADELVNYAKGHQAYKSSIISDMTSSPDYNSLVEQIWLDYNMPEFPDIFYSLNGSMLKAQAEEHGGY